MVTYTVAQHLDGYWVVEVRGTCPMVQDWDIGAAGQRIMSRARADDIGRRLSAEPLVTVDRQAIRADAADTAVITIEAPGAATATVRLLTGESIDAPLVDGVGHLDYASDEPGLHLLQIGADGYYQEASLRLEVTAP